MRALVKAGPGPGLELREVAVPVPGPGQLLIRVLAASICGTDIHIERWDDWGQTNFAVTPMVFGHE
ncbi:MAG: L-threonine 3-dehydrogenase, partial [Chloroflexota bacterium]